MDFGANKTPGEIIQEGAFRDTYFNKTSILVLIQSDIKIHKKNFISWKTLIRSFIVQVIMMSVSVNMVLNAKHC